jgi:hypothetical protein
MILFISTILFGCSKDNEYPVVDNNTLLKQGLENFINRGEDKKISISIKNKCYIDNVLLVSYITNEGSLGCADLHKIKNNKYNIDSLGYGTATIHMTNTKTNKGKYFIVIGRKYSKRIQYLKVKLDKDYVFNIDGKDYFIEYYMIPDTLKNVHTTDFWLYDNNNVDITEDIMNEDYKYITNKFDK